MSHRSRRTLGMVLLTAPIAIAVILYLCGVSLFSANFHGLSGSTTSGSFTGQFHFHWLCFVLVSAVVVGLWLLLFSRHE